MGATDLHLAVGPRLAQNRNWYFIAYLAAAGHDFSPTWCGHSPEAGLC